MFVLVSVYLYLFLYLHVYPHVYLYMGICIRGRWQLLGFILKSVGAILSASDIYKVESEAAG